MIGVAWAVLAEMLLYLLFRNDVLARWECCVWKYHWSCYREGHHAGTRKCWFKKTAQSPLLPLKLLNSSSAISLFSYLFSFRILPARYSDPHIRIIEGNFSSVIIFLIAVEIDFAVFA